MIKLRGPSSAIVKCALGKLWLMGAISGDSGTYSITSAAINTFLYATWRGSYIVTSRRWEWPSRRVNHHDVDIAHAGLISWLIYAVSGTMHAWNARPSRPCLRRNLHCLPLFVLNELSAVISLRIVCSFIQHHKQLPHEIILWLSDGWKLGDVSTDGDISRFLFCFLLSVTTRWHKLHLITKIINCRGGG